MNDEVEGWEYPMPKAESGSTLYEFTYHSSCPTAPMFEKFAVNVPANSIPQLVQPAQLSADRLEQLHTKHNRPSYPNILTASEVAELFTHIAALTTKLQEVNSELEQYREQGRTKKNPTPPTGEKP